MIKRIILLTFMLAGFSGEALAAHQEIEPIVSIQNIVMYPESAMIRKQAAFHLKKGQNVVRISGITTDMADASVQTSIRGGTGVKIDDVKVEKTFLTKTSQEKTDKLKSRLENLEEQIKAGKNEITVLNSSTDFLKKVMPFPQNQRTTTSEVDTYLKYFSGSLSENYKKIAKSEDKLKKLEEEKKALEKELKDLSALQDESKSIVISIFAPDDYMQITLLFSYVVNRAGWFPQYDIRADSSAKVAFDCFATIRQATGEDWKGINIEISTAKPFVYGEAPVLSPWLVDIYHPRPVMSKSALRRDFEEVQPMMAMEKGSEAATDRDYEQPQVKSETSSFSFVLPRKVDVPSDNQPHKILIAFARQDTRFNYYAVPKLSRYSYLRTDFQNQFQFPLLKGPLNIFLDNRLVGTSSINKNILPNEEISMSLGVDEGIKVEKKLIKKFTEYAAFTKETTVNYEFVIDVINGKDREISLTVNDNVPVSRNEQIKVELDTPKKGEARVGEDGIITWDLKLAKGEKKTLKVKFKVVHPKNLIITGLE